MNFWDNTHPLAADSERLFEQLVPSMGAAPSLQGECLRASSRIGYDWYNNGWGCNNWSGAVVFLEEHAMHIGAHRSAKEFEAFCVALGQVRHYCHGERIGHTDAESADRWVTTIQAFVVQCILDNPELIANKLDMQDLNEPGVPMWHRDEDEEEDDWEEED